jgi:ApaG protein
MAAIMARYQIRVEVQPRYLPEQSDPEQDLYTFAYTITVTNTGDVPSQLISREWVITDAAGGIEEVRGLGVVGQQPLLRPGESYQYTSGCRLRTPNGSMEGSYFFVAEDAERFEVEIPAFRLSDGGAHVLH